MYGFVLGFLLSSINKDYNISCELFVHLENEIMLECRLM